MQNDNLKLKIFFLAILFYAFFGLEAKGVSAETYYVDKASIGGACNNTNAGTVISAPWCAISKANTTLTAGDTVYLRAGSYTEQIAPTNNGTSGNQITFAKYESETVNITYSSSNPQANLVGKTYITINGLNFLNATGSWINLATGGSYCIIQNCYFSGASTYAGINLYNSSNYNKILNNTMTAANCTMTYASDVPSKYATQAIAEDASYCPGDLVYIVRSSYNVIQGNTFLNTEHAGVSIMTGYYGSDGGNIVRGNVFNNPWHSNLIVSWHNHIGKNLVEDNIIHDAGSTAATENPFYVARNQTLWGRKDHAGLQGGGGVYNQIVRRNVFYENGKNSITAYESGAESKYNKYYNNTIHGGVYDIQFDAAYECSNNIIKNNSLTPSSLTTYLTYSGFAKDGVVYNGWPNYFIRNNLFGNTNRYKGTYGTAAYIATVWGSEWINNINADPLYTNAATHDYTLQAGSPNIDAGDWLTTITSASGSGTTFTVADSGYFFDGWGIVGEAGDTIQLKGQTATAIITNINYSTHSITVDRPLAWTQNIGVALAYSGSSPDIGAYEYQSSGDTTPPAVPTELSVW